VAPVLPGCVISHGTPVTSVGRHARPYLFPEGLVWQFRESWADERRMKASFRGLLTPARAKALERWQGAEGVYITDTDRGRRAGTKYHDPGYAHELGSSEYVLCPNGDLPFSYRVFEAMLAGAKPLVETPHKCYGTEACLELLGASSLEQLLPWDRELAEHNFEAARKLVTVPAEELLEEVLRLRGPR
jgi:hypothetical protein